MASPQAEEEGEGKGRREVSCLHASPPMTAAPGINWGGALCGPSLGLQVERPNEAGARRRAVPLTVRVTWKLCGGSVDSWHS